MLRTIFMIGLFAVLGLIALRIVFGILPGIIGLFVGPVILVLFLAVTRMARREYGARAS